MACQELKVHWLASRREHEVRGRGSERERKVYIVGWGTVFHRPNCGAQAWGFKRIPHIFGRVFLEITLGGPGALLGRLSEVLGEAFGGRGPFGGPAPLLGRLLEVPGPSWR